ncbi:MAG: tRNA (adenosine(37)-N6)-threonylcarbamoyltransferase complex dimerization subunit type 1 TsaB [Pseudomonadota bacterium]
MLIFAIDTAGPPCSTCIFDTASNDIIAEMNDDIGRGHAEYLMPQIKACLEKTQIGLKEVDLFIAAVGPGSFTGIRVGVSAARGFALALKKEARGVTTLDALATDFAAHATSPFAVAVKAGRDMVYAQTFDESAQAQSQPQLLKASDAACEFSGRVETIVGNGGPLLVEESDCFGKAFASQATGRIATIARLGVLSDRTASPLYIRQADARPQTGFAVARALKSERQVP